MRITINAEYDSEASVWYVAHSSLPGLHIEGATLPELQERLPGAIEDLLEGSGRQEVDFDLITHGHVTVAA